MTRNLHSARSVLAVLAGLVVMTLAPCAHAQWADQRYQYRVPISISNTTTHAYAAGEFVTATLPIEVLAAGSLRPDGADVSLYYNGSPIPVKTLPMGGSLKTVFALPAPLAAAPQYSISENLDGGKTTYSTLPAGTKLTFDGGIDDNFTVITLPFAFPFKAGTYDKLAVNIDGFCGPGSTNPGRSDNPDTITGYAAKNVIAPFASDFMIGDGATQDAVSGVYADISDPTKVTIRWEVKPSGGSAVVARFACQLYPDGNIRFIYSSQVDQDTVNVTWCDPVYGVGVGDPAISLITPTFSMSDQFDILYTQAIPTPVSQSGYGLYFGAPSVNTPPASPTGLQSWDFSDGQKHGWRSHQDLVNNADIKIVVDTDGVKSLYMDTSDPNDEDPNNGNHAWFSPDNMTPLADQTVYWKARRPDWDYAFYPTMRFKPVTLTDSNNLSYITLSVDQPAIGFQFHENYGAGGFQVANYFTPADPYTNGRTPPLPRTYTGHSWIPYPVAGNEAAYQYLVTSSWDVNGSTIEAAKGWQVSPSNPTVGSDPEVGGFTMTRDTSPDSWAIPQPVPAGIIAWMHHSGSAYLKWVCAVPGGYAELISTKAATVETAPAPGPGKAVLQGVAYDASIGVTAPMAGVTLTLKDAANNILATSVTDVTGRYRYVIDAGPTAAALTITGTKPGSKGTATQSVVENTIYTVNVPIVFGARAQGVVYDTQTNGGVVGATINLLAPGTSTVVFTTTTDAMGRYVLDMDTPGTYDIAVSAGSYTSQTATGVAYASQSVVTRDFGLVAPELLVNGGFETEAPVVDPAGYPGALRPAGFTTWDQQATAVTAPISNDIALLDSEVDVTQTFYLINALRARTGTHSVAIKRVPNIGSTSVQWMSDTGSLVPVSPNQTYRISLWANGTPGMQVRARIRFSSTNFAASSPSVVLTGSDTTFYADDRGGKWRQFSAVVTAPAAPAYMMVRFYGTFVGADVLPQVVYFDDLSVKAISPRIITGKVVDGTAAGVGGIAVGANIGRPGMADPSATATSSTIVATAGDFTLSLWDKGVVNFQTYAPGYMVGPQKAVDTSATYAVAEPISLLAPSVPAVNVAVAAEVSTTSASGLEPETYFEVPPILGFDGSNVNRGNSQWSQARTIQPLVATVQLPISITADLGRNYTFSQLTWVWAWGHGGPQSYDILTSTDGTTFAPVYQAEGTGGMVWAQPGAENSHSAIQLSSPVNARYIRLVFHSKDRTSRGNLGFSEFRVDLPGAEVTGSVTKIDGTLVNGAYVGIRGGSGSMVSYGITNASGAYHVIIPTSNAVGLVAHYLPDGDNVVAISDPLLAQASASSTLTLPAIKMADPVPNLVPLTATAFSENCTDESASYLPANAVDHVYTTRWSAYTSSRIVPSAPVNFVLDLGSPQTFNHANIMWGLQFGGWYAIDVSDDGATWRTILHNQSNYSGYKYASDKFVDVETLPLTTARYVRVQSQWSEQGWADIFEFQLANVMGNPLAPFALTRKALRITAGLEAGPTAGAAFDELNVVTTGSSTGKVDLLDADALAKQGK